MVVMGVDVLTVDVFDLLWLPSTLTESLRPSWNDAAVFFVEPMYNHG